MPDFNLSITTLANALGVACQKVNELLRERHAVSTIMALRLSRLFGNSPEFWLKRHRPEIFRWLKKLKTSMPHAAKLASHLKDSYHCLRL